MNITLNNLSLASQNIVTEKISIDPAPVSNLNAQVLYRRDRSKLISQQFGPRSIVISGHLVESTFDNLLALIDLLKLASVNTNMNLDLIYTGGTRRYVVNYSNLDIPREFYNVTSVPFTLELLAPDPIAINTIVNTTTYTMTGTTLNETINILGTVYPEPIIKIIPNTNITSFALYNSYLGQTLTLTTSISANKIILIDEANLSITIDGTQVDYSGVIPKFAPGANTVIFTTAPALTNAPITFNYYSRWL